MLHANDDFLRAVEDAPRETTLRLAYSDWLTEQDDPRGELIRIEEEMRTLPVFANRFWALKPQRNQLRAEAGPEWCARMRYGTECLPVFTHGIPDGWRERWRLIREFAERWHDIPMPDIGGRRAEIAEAEKRLGKVLPPSVREWVAFVADIGAAPNYTGELRPTRLQPVPGTTAVSLQLLLDTYERFGDSHSAVLAEELHLADPPVYWFYSEFDEDDNAGFVRSEGKPQAMTVTAFALTHVVNLAVGSSGFTVMLDQLADLYRHLNRSFPTHVKFDECEWDESDNLLVEIEPYPIPRGTFCLTVRADRSIRAEQIPSFLWGYARLSSSAYGLFAQPESKQDF